MEGSECKNLYLNWYLFEMIQKRFPLKLVLCDLMVRFIILQNELIIFISLVIFRSVTSCFLCTHGSPISECACEYLLVLEEKKIYHKSFT